jgi:hypothetical protein
MCWSGHRYQVPEGRADRRPATQVDAGVRAADADRQRVIDQLRVHTADGRLTLDEFETRVGEAWAAATHGELRSVLRELPVLETTRPRRRRRVGPPVPVLIVALVVIGSLLMNHFAWWLIPVGFWMFGGCGAPRHRDTNRRDEVLTSA